MLTNLLNAKTVRVETSCVDYTDAIDISSGLLVKTGSIKESYVNAIKKSLEKNGPYMVLAPEVALLHARPEDGVNEACMSLLVVNSGVAFGHKEHDPVKLIFTFGAVDNTSHLEALKELMALLTNESSFRRLKQAVTKEEVLQIIKNQESIVEG